MLFQDRKPGMSTPSHDIDALEAPLQQSLSALETQVQNAGLPREATLQLREVLEKQRRVLQRVQEDRDRFDRAMEAGQAGMVRWDMRANKAWWNACAYRIHGYTPYSFEPTYEFWLSQLHPDDRQRVDAQFNTCCSQQQSELICEYRVIRPGGEVRWVRGIGRFTFDANGVAESFTGIARDITDQKQVQEALARSEAELREAQRVADVGSWTWEPDSDAVTWSEETYHIFGRDPNTPAPGYPQQAGLYTPESWARLQPAVAAAVRSGTPYELDLQVVRPDGTTRWIIARCEPVQDATGRVVKLRGTAQDITPRRRAEEVLRETDATLRRLKEANIIGIIQGEGPRITDANETFLRMLGYSREELERDQLLWPQITPPEYASRDEYAMRQLSIAGAIRPFEKEYLRKGGGRVPVLIGAAKTADVPLRWICFVMDMTEQKRAESERARLAALVQNSNDFIGLAEFDGTPLFLNAGGRRLVGLDPEGPLPPVAEFLFPDDRALYVQEVLPRIMRGERWAGEVTFRHFKTQEPIAVLWDCFAIKDPKTGKPVCIATVTRDIREQKKAQGAIQRSKEMVEQASQAKDRFLAALSHELRTPLTPVLVAVQVMGRDPAFTPEQRDEIHMVERNVALEAKLIDDLLDLTRISQGKMELHLGPVDMHLLLQEVAEICRSELQGKEFHFTMDLAASHHHVLGDAARLHQAVWNLLKNAIKFTPAGGSVTLRTEQPAEGRLAITVSDTGMGIAPELLPRVFEAFEQGDASTTRHFGGLGLGLAISKEIVDLHGGTITAWSEGKGLGTTFTIELATSPAAETQYPQSEGQPARQEGRRSGRILLVEDHSDTRMLMARVLRQRGYEVRTAASVAEAFGLSTTENIDLIVCDIGLPDGSGLDLMRQLAVTHRPIKAIALSGFGMEEDISKSRRAGFLEHLTKPVDLNLLERTVDRIIQTPLRQN
jgi:PAS domain S-box-containing protein